MTGFQAILRTALVFGALAAVVLGLVFVALGLWGIVGVTVAALVWAAWEPPARSHRQQRRG